MAKFKQAGRKTSGRASKQSQSKPQMDQLSHKLGESAQQVWLAGVGAFTRAQAEGTKLFETLVKEGTGFEQTARKIAGGRAEVVREAVENRVGQARERATDTWDRLEKVFEDRVQRALNTLGVPTREDLTDLSSRVETLTAELRRQGGKPAARSTARKSPARKTSGTAKKAVGKKTSVRKTSKRASKRAN